MEKKIEETKIKTEDYPLYAWVKNHYCPQCGRNMSKFSKENFGVCNGCKNRNKETKNGSNTRN